MKAMHLLRCSILLAVPAAASCASLGSNGLPAANADAFAQSIRVDKRGIVKLFKDLSGDPLPAGITQGPDGAIWFTDIGNGAVGRITGGGKYTLQVDVGGVSDGITVGPDSNLWFTESGANEIGRISTTGLQFPAFTLPAGSEPEQIVAGPSGTVWFTQAGTDQIGELTTAGVLSELSVPTANAQPFGIAVGPNGKIWFTERGGNRIGYVTV